MADTSKTLVKDPAYQSLLNQVRKTLVEGQARIEQERVRTYWETGRVIHVYILKYERAKRGAETIKQLAKDLSVDRTTLHRCIQFVQAYPDLRKVGARQLMSWTHYRKLIAVADDKKRVRLESEALKNEWSADELALRIKEQNPPRRDAKSCVSTKESIPANNKPLVPLRGELYTYRVIKRKVLPAFASSDLVIDLGFSVIYDPAVEAHGRVPLRNFNDNDVITSKPKDNTYTFTKTDRTARDLFTYAAYIEKVIDGDTIKVYIDLGFNTWTHQTLRLRDLDCPEVGTKAGDEARTFVQALLKESQMVIIRSSKSDKYDRYLADVFIPQDSEGILGNTPRASRAGASLEPVEDVYLNNLLLETGRAVRM